MAFCDRLLEIDPHNTIAHQFLDNREETVIPIEAQDEAQVRGQNVSESPTPTEDLPSLEEGSVESAKFLIKEYPAIAMEAAILLREFRTLYIKTPIDENAKQILLNLENISNGQFLSVISDQRPMAVGALVRDIENSPAQFDDLIRRDFAEYAEWVSSEGLAEDAVRARLGKRCDLLIAALSEDRADDIMAIFNQVEMRHLKREYRNNETMLGDDVKDIPEERFFVTDDGWVFDMQELADCLTANSGIMRNPLSRDMFSTGDIRRIVNHPLGAVLRSQQQQQGQLRRGISSHTIQKVKELGELLLEDQSNDLRPSYEALDVFIAFMATLTANEQRALDSLKITGVDHLNGRPFESTIGASVRDAKDGTTCTHKVSTPDLVKKTVKIN